MALTRRSTRPRFTLLVLVLAAVTIITIAYRGHADSVINSVKSDALDAFAPVQSAVGDVARPIGNFFDGAAHYGSLQSENARLRAENSRLQTQALQSADAQTAFQNLLKTLNLPWAQNIPTVPAEVVRWLSTSPDADALNGQNIEAQDVCEELGLLPGWTRTA